MSGSTRHEWGRPAEGPWWRFVPRNRASGVLSLVAGVLLVGQSVLYLALGGDSAGRTVLEVVVGVLGVLLVLRSVDGLRVLDRGPGPE
ncbi:hypothetical protein GCM10018793_43640 [Streptomyces sulfonofaciens]|uniref:Uncharacterized protein n=1 Tax=Streptomyces sulfonofaciens TaxID=68272 RepID=A0A919L2W4_9ACTN|nr:hypothetical protein [Streptomyces sulfonofaciens]GHH82900.1 hypothetical protein GCM10018793_43640 [Streptomyces sulfonofaciens]